MKQNMKYIIQATSMLVFFAYETKDTEVGLSGSVACIRKVPRSSLGRDTGYCD
jgi:hypothetical protein